MPAPAAVGELGYNHVLTPVGIDVRLMLALAVLINHYLLRRPYANRRSLKAGEIVLKAPQPKTLELKPPFNDDNLERINAHALLPSTAARPVDATAATR